MRSMLARDPSIGKVEARISGVYSHSLLHSVFEASLDHMRPCHKPMTQTLYYKEIVLDNSLRYSYILSQAPCCPIFPSPDSSRYLN